MPVDLQEPVQIGAAGLNLRDSPLEVGITGLIDALNWRLDQRGALVKALGTAQSSFANFAQATLELAAYNPSTASSSTLVAYCGNGAVIKGSPSSPSNIVTGLSTSAVPSFAQMLDKLYWSNGTDAVYQWDGTTATAISGVNDVQTITTTGTPTGGTFTLTYTPTGATTVPIAYNASAATVQAALVTILGSGNISCSGGALPTGVVCTFANALGFANQPVFTHADLLTGGSSPVVVVTHTTPGRGDAPKGKYLAVWRNRLWVAGVAANPNRVYWSGAGDPTVWTSTNFVDILGPRGDLITAIHPSPNIGTDADGADGVLVYKQRSAHRIIDEADNINGIVSGGANVMIDSATGCVAARTVRTVNGRVYSLAIDGIYSTDGHSGLQLESDQLGPLLSQVTARSNITSAIGIGYRGSYMLAVSASGSGALNTRILEVYTTLGRPGGHPIMALITNAAVWTTYTDAALGDLVLYTNGTADGTGKVLQMFSGGVFAPSGQALTATATTGASMFGTTAVKRFRRIRAVGRGQLNIGILADFEGGTGDVEAFTVDVGTNASYWNQVNWNQFNWAGQGDTGVTPVTAYYGTRGRWFAFTVSETSSTVSQTAGALGTNPVPVGGAALQQMQCTLTPLSGEV